MITTAWFPFSTMSTFLQPREFNILSRTLLLTSLSSAIRILRCSAEREEQHREGEGEAEGAGGGGESGG